MQNNTGRGIDAVNVAMQGDGRIYANGVMQAAVSITCTLDTGTVLERIELRKMYSGELITDLGYVVSEEDNGFQHEITESKSAATVTSAPGRDIITRTFYISTEERASIDIGFVVITDDDEWSSVDGTPTGSVRLTPLTPVIYSGQDFELRYLKHYTDIYTSTIISGLHNKTNPLIAYPVITGLVENPGGILSVDTEKASLRDHSRADLVQPPTQPEAQIYHWTGGYLTSVGLQTFSLVESVDPHDRVDITVPTSNAAMIVVSQAALEKFYAGDYICTTEYGTDDPDQVYYCGQYSQPGISDFAVDEGRINDFLDTPVKTAEVLLTDQYGTSYPLRFLTSAAGVVTPDGKVYGIVIEGAGASAQKCAFDAINHKVTRP